MDYFMPAVGATFSHQTAQYLMALSAAIAVFGMGFLWVVGKGIG